MNLENQVRSILLLQPRDNDYAELVALFKHHEFSASRYGRPAAWVPNSGTSVRHRTCAGHRGLAHGRGVRALAQPSRSRAIFWYIQRLTEPDAWPVQAGPAISSRSPRADIGRPSGSSHNRAAR